MCALSHETPVQYMSGVGKRRAEALASLGIYTVGDLMRDLPHSYQNRGNIRLLSEAPYEEKAAYMLTVGSEPINSTVKNRMVLTKFSAFDDSRNCTITFFNQGYLKKVFAPGATFRFFGKLTHRMGLCEMASPDFEAADGRVLPDFLPFYKLRAGLTQKLMRSLINTALESSPPPPDPLPPSVLEKSSVLPLGEALRIIHNPANYAELEKARERFIFEELYIFSLGMALSGRREKRHDAPEMSPVDMKPFYDLFPFEATGAQMRAIFEITADMTNPERIPMARMLSGDVGCGKTFCAAAAVYLSVKNKKQAALMAPTEILAIQHYSDLAPLFEKLGISCSLLTGSTRAAEKKKIRAALEDGSLDFIIGTHALLSEGVNFASPGLVITDEQHRFGVMQRATLGEKGGTAHTLVMSATPIPRTLSLILWGDLDRSVIDEMPKGRKKVSTFVVNEDYRARLEGFIAKLAYEGRQTYIVCPTIDTPDEGEEDGIVEFGYVPGDDEKPALKSATGYAEALSERMPGVSVGLIHGRLKPAEKEKVMRDFADGKISVLVSTTVIEVGVNIPNAVLMVVENAERFGLSQLHQLRGRVGRGEYKSWCILVSDSTGEKAKERLRSMTETNDGYKIAEYDLAIRGPGDFFPKNGEARQSGEGGFSYASLCGNMELLNSAVDAAQSTLNIDPNLSLSENLPSAEMLNKLLSVNIHAMN